MQTFTVVSTDARGAARRVVLSDERDTRVILSFHRYAQIGKGDTVFIDPEHANRTSVVSSEDASDLIRVTPHFEQSATLTTAGLELLYRVTEITTAEDVEAYTFLESFHYRTSSLPTEDGEAPEIGSAGVGGRRAVLLLYVRLGLRWQPIGYIELQMPLLMVKPRHELFALPFRHPKRKLGWESWDQHAIREHVNKIVRIARVVTSPEFRGLGISRLLIRSAKEFAKERWHIGGARPLFIEISAEMLKYLDFVSSSGLRYAGSTEGNLQRVHKDLTYMQRNYHVSSGIMSLQKKYLSRLQRGGQALRKSQEDMLRLVSEVAANPNRIKSLEPAEYYYLKSVLRFPIPYYIGGLDEAAETYLRQATQALLEHNPDKLATRGSGNELRVRPGTLRYTSIDVTTSYQLPKSSHVQAILDCFGLSGDDLQARVITNFSLEASAGNIIFVTGPSGSGKSLLLHALDPNGEMRHVQVRRSARDGASPTVGWIRDLPSDTPLIELFASRWGMERSLAALNQAGLSEAYVYLKPFGLLSRGQRYRARLADLALRDEQVWLIDEFGADLDPMTAKIVASNLRKHVIKYQRIAIVAAANYDHYIAALRPTRIVRLRHGFSPETFTYKDYIDEFHRKVG